MRHANSLRRRLRWLLSEGESKHALASKGNIYETYAIPKGARTQKGDVQMILGEFHCHLKNAASKDANQYDEEKEDVVFLNRGR